MTDAEKARLRLLRLQNRSESAGRGPIEGFELGPLPAKILKIVPEMEQWRQNQNERIRDHFKKLNTTLPS